MIEIGIATPITPEPNFPKLVPFRPIIPRTNNLINPSRRLRRPARGLNIWLSSREENTNTNTNTEFDNFADINFDSDFEFE